MKLQIWAELRRKGKRQNAVVLLDPHGDLALEVAQLKEFARIQNRARLVYLDPNLKASYSPSFNPFMFEA